MSVLGFSIAVVGTVLGIAVLAIIVVLAVCFFLTADLDQPLGPDRPQG